MTFDRALAATIDYTLLRVDARRADVERLCDEALRFGFAAVCVNPVHVRACLARMDAEGSRLPVCTVIGFPLGATMTAVKEQEVECTAEEGAVEFDAVLPVGALLDGDFKRVAHDVRTVTWRAKNLVPGAVVKIICETALLDAETMRAACDIIAAAEADFVKTSTGFAGGVTAETVRLLHSVAPPGLRIKASGGIRTRAQARAMLDAGADRIGSSTGPLIVTSQDDMEDA